MKRGVLISLCIFSLGLFSHGLIVRADDSSDAQAGSNNTTVDSNSATGSLSYQQAEQAQVDPNHVFDGTQPNTTEHATFTPDVPDAGQGAPVPTDSNSSDNDQGTGSNTTQESE